MITVSHYAKCSEDNCDQLFSMSAEDKTGHN